MFGSQTNDLVLLLRKRRIGKVLLGGMLADRSVESLCATSSNGHQAALVNDAFLAHAVVWPDDLVVAVETAALQ